MAARTGAPVEGVTLLDRLNARFRRAGRSRPALSASDLQTAWQAVALLMDYPSEQLRGRLDEIEGAVAGLPSDIRTPLARLTGWLRQTEWGAVQREYVATFDTTRKCALHLSYFRYGDTRKRGVALVRFKQAYRAAEVELSDAELPDHLCVVCEFGASVDADGAWKLLNEHRAGLEVLRLALQQKSSPWADGIVGLLATLPPLDGDDESAVATLLAEGPPNEDVGMDAYALDPRLNPHPAADEAALEGVRA